MKSFISYHPLWIHYHMFPSYTAHYETTVSILFHFLLSKITIQCDLLTHHFLSLTYFFSQKLSSWKWNSEQRQSAKIFFPTVKSSNFEKWKKMSEYSPRVSKVFYNHFRLTVTLDMTIYSLHSFQSNSMTFVVMTSLFHTPYKNNSLPSWMCYYHQWFFMVKVFKNLLDNDAYILWPFFRNICNINDWDGSGVFLEYEDIGFVIINPSVSLHWIVPLDSNFAWIGSEAWFKVVIVSFWKIFYINSYFFARQIWMHLHTLSCLSMYSVSARTG